MGIPSYFSHIVRKHRNIIKKYSSSNISIDNLYLDCNSIIYDSVRLIKGVKNTRTFEKKLIKTVCEKIVYYIEEIAPQQRVYIAFDGVAPVAKLEQQRNRRYKSWFEKELCEKLREEDSSDKSISHSEQQDPSIDWNTVSITPGTKFMKDLGNGVRAFFKNKAAFGLEEIIVSPSDKEGEGEHKIYEYIRDNADYHNNTATAIYGLDADLIMLTLNHLHISNKLYLFRETPHFIKSIDKSLDPNTNYLMDIPELGEMLKRDLSLDSCKINNAVILDYILLCFFLGNDFMPHFPSLNIRTDGINHLLGAYRSTILAKNLYLTDGRKIVWKNLRKLVEYLSENEHDYLKAEYVKRRKMRPRHCQEDEDRILARLMDVPILDRTCEEYINPSESGWRNRYYKELFDIDIDRERCKQICKNYLEGMEWTINYYTRGCKDWRWTYRYEYPPLLTDLVRHIPHFDTEMLVKQPKNPVKDLVQLSYVIPRPYLNLLPSKLHKKLLEKCDHLYRTDCKIVWAYCRYLWEAHAILPHIDIGKLEHLLN
tara:strand:+ start:3078 stop:4694 length:1617 start_codon:yes stop_codon:yes gene_type:complete